MINRDDPQFLEERIRSFTGQNPPPRAPLGFKVEDTGSGVRVTITNDGPMGGRLNGAVRYDVYWAAAPVDTSTAAGKAAGFARAVCLAPSIPATSVDHTTSTAMYDDPKHAAGYFYCCGVDAYGTRSAPTEPAQVTTGATDYTIPGDVVHFQVSESGEVANETVFSVLSVAASPPAGDLTNFGGLQLYLKDFLRLGDVQEGYFHRFSGGGGISFKVPYPIPRRRGSGSISLTNGSTSVTGTNLLAIAQANDQLEAYGRRATIASVTDTAITLSANWAGDTLTATVEDYVIIAYVTVFGVSVSKAGTRRADTTAAPSKSVLMDGELSAPNYPAVITISRAGAAVRVSWEQIAGTHISGYNIYRSSGSSVDSGMTAGSPPRPASGTKLLSSYAQNSNLRAGATNVNMQFDDSNFTSYELETNAEFVYYVTTSNVRGDESAANYAAAYCRTIGIFEVDPTIPARNPGKNYLYNGAMHGTIANTVAGNDTTQDTYMNTDASNLPGRSYGDAAGQANGTGRLRGYTRWSSGDGGGGAAGAAPTHQNEDEIHITAPGATKVWYAFQEIGAWQEASAPFRKIGKGEVYTLSVELSRGGGGATDGTVYFYLDQYDNNTFKDESKRRYRDSAGAIQTTAAHLNIAGSELTTTKTRYQASFQTDSALSPTKQIRINFAWEGGTTGIVIVSKAMLNAGDTAAQWTADMGDTAISLPNPGGTPGAPLDDRVSTRVGDARRLPP